MQNELILYPYELPVIYFCRDDSKDIDISYEVIAYCPYGGFYMPPTAETFRVLDKILQEKGNVFLESNRGFALNKSDHRKIDNINLDIDTSGWSSDKIFMAKLVQHIKDTWINGLGSIIVEQDPNTHFLDR